MYKIKTYFILAIRIITMDKCHLRVLELNRVADDVKMVSRNKTVILCL